MDKKVLHVVDMSPCIYAGSFNRHSFIQGDIVNTGNGYRERNIPTGGASMLFNILGQYMGTGPIAFVADRNPTIKKDKYPDYKGSRTHPNNVSVGKDVAEYILKDCGFTIYAEDGYEADDVIFTIVRQNRMKYDHIYVHTADSDLYILVRDNVSILPTSSQAKLQLYVQEGQGNPLQLGGLPEVPGWRSIQGSASASQRGQAVSGGAVLPSQPDALSRQSWGLALYDGACVPSVFGAAHAVLPTRGAERLQYC